MDEAENLHKNHDIYLVPGLQRGLEVLEALSETGAPMSASQIGKALGISRSSAFRLIYTLRSMGYIDFNEQAKTYELGPRVLSLGFSFLNRQSIIETARRDLEILRDATNVCAHLAIRDGREVLFLSSLQPRTGFQSNFNVGTRLPAYASPLGWILLRELSFAQIDALYQSRPFTPITDQTPGSIQALLDRISECIARGYVISQGIVEPGGCTIAAPVFDRTGAVVAAIDISGPDSSFPHSLVEFYLPEVLSAAQRTSSRLGYMGSGTAA